MQAYEALVILGFILIFVGVALIFIGTLALAFSSGREGKAEAGGVVLIGPIPLVFGTSWRATIIASIVAVVLMVLAIIVMLMARRAVPPGA
ncbi:TIGR00304 family membrane protein [Stetteria hydrogenophila]